jgi:hypothetical protein
MEVYLFVICQIGAVIFTFIDIRVSIALVIGNVLSFVILLLLLIKVRIKEKKEEDENDYSDY